MRKEKKELLSHFFRSEIEKEFIHSHCLHIVIELWHTIEFLCWLNKFSELIISLITYCYLIVGSPLNMQTLQLFYILALRSCVFQPGFRQLFIKLTGRFRWIIIIVPEAPRLRKRLKNNALWQEGRTSGPQRPIFDTYEHFWPKFGTALKYWQSCVTTYPPNIKTSLTRF